MRIKVAKAPRAEVKPISLLGTLCYYYPQYTLQEARNLPYKHVILLINTAHRIKAADNLNLLQIVAAPNYEGRVNELINYYKGQL